MPVAVPENRWSGWISLVGVDEDDEGRGERGREVQQLGGADRRAARRVESTVDVQFGRVPEVEIVDLPPVEFQAGDGRAGEGDLLQPKTLTRISLESNSAVPASTLVANSASSQLVSARSEPLS